ncbi:MAG: FMN-binding protein [Oscillospiraceae bacterium]
MKNNRISGILFSTAAVAVAVLLAVLAESGLESRILANEAAVSLAEMQRVSPKSESFSATEYTGEDKNIDAVFKSDTGYVIKTTTAGYAGGITALTGIENDGYVTGVLVTDMRETPGLGGQSKTSEWFLNQFIGKKEAVAVGETVDALSGATVTSKAVTNGVNSAVAFVTGADIDSSATEWED